MSEIKVDDYRYEGDDSLQPPPEGCTDNQGRTYFPYLPEPELKDAINLAMYLERPLLLEGEPGCGKTCLAGAIAYEFTCKYIPHDLNNESQAKRWWPFYTWDIKSTSRASDGLYTFDAVARLRDAQLMGADPKRLTDFLDKLEVKKLKARLLDRERKPYREFGPLGEALRPKKELKDKWQQGLRPIVLIDEIDKADSDFTNDLLLELEEWRFTIPETKESIPAPPAKPIVIITSNREKPLPDPFLRRCIYFYVDFPQTRLPEIIERRFGDQVLGKEELVEQAIERLEEVRAFMADLPEGRSPGTSEFLLFLFSLINKDQEVALDDLEELAERLPLLGTLIKTREAQLLYQQFHQSENG
ncbi:AAA family ATPase [Acaryochloris marina]|uniref:AAA family ATPase n=1 Tax=Acaryochloris marina TaxID=155978 RepID=UPI0021C2CD3A|nr:MoxR family ATPase [Acaryochloris marina]BDM83547.1 ATPase AAA [Acaryochloris marina MBIC10699]